MKKDQICLLSSERILPTKALQLATKIALKHEKEICIIPFKNKECIKEQVELLQSKTSVNLHLYQSSENLSLVEILENIEASMLIIELNKQKPFNQISSLLKACRNLRIPYFFIKEETEKIKLNKILVPITYLAEEKEKGIFASGLGKNMQAEVVLMPANDYGSRAKLNTLAIKTLLEKQAINFSEIKAKKGSYKVQTEAIKKAEEINADLVLITASREYGLDDIIFGPSELHIIKKSTIPIMILNPRPDLYVLCK